MDRIIILYKLIISPIAKTAAFVLIISLLLLSAAAQTKLAILTPDKNEQSETVLDILTKNLSHNTTILDQFLVESIFGYEDFKRPYNLSVKESRNLGTRIGSNFIILVKTDTFRRSSFEKDEYYESFAAIYLVSSRTGKLVFWEFNKFEKDSAAKSKSALLKSLNKTAKKILNKIRIANKMELEANSVLIAVLPDGESQSVHNYRPPLPYKRLKPKYTKIASFYDILATIDVAVEFDSNGKVTKTEILRWAGFGLEESVIKTIREMQWRAAERNGVRLPIRVLLRYNFKNIKTDK